MRKTVMSTLAVALLLGVCGSRSALADSNTDLKPVAVVSLASYDKLLGNVELAGRLSGRPKLAKGLEGMLAVVTQGRGLAGVDTKRPWGVVIQADGSALGGYAFLPVDDFQKFQEVLQPYVKTVEDLGGGLHKVQGKGLRQTIYVKHIQSGWLLVCDKPEGLANAPDDPTKILDGLPEHYDLAARLNVSNLPAAQREKLIAKLRERAEKDLQRRPGEDEQDYAIRKLLAAKLLAGVLTTVEDLDTVTLGWSSDEGAQRAAIEMALTAKGGTKSAYTLEQFDEVKTSFAGFRLPGAVLTGSVAASCPHADSTDLDELFKAIRVKAFGDVDAREASTKRAEAVKEFLGGLLEVIQETVASGRADGAVSVLLSPGAATLVAGRYVADGRKLEATCDKLVEAARQEDPGLVDTVLKRDVDTLQGVRLHTLSIPVPPDAKNRDKVVQLVGETLQVVVGFGEQSVYLAAGRDAIQTLKKAIEQSAAAGQHPTPPMEVSLALGQLAEFLAEAGQGGQQQRAATLAAALKDAAGKDHVKLVAVPIERGVKLRLELEPGVLKMIESRPKQPAKLPDLTDRR
jgi:hypothetical protein